MAVAFVSLISSNNSWLSLLAAAVACYLRTVGTFGRYCSIFFFSPLIFRRYPPRENRITTRHELCFMRCCYVPLIFLCPRFISIEPSIPWNVSSEGIFAETLSGDFPSQSSLFWHRFLRLPFQTSSPLEVFNYIIACKCSSTRTSNVYVRDKRNRRTRKIIFIWGEYLINVICSISNLVSAMLVLLFLKRPLPWVLSMNLPTFP